MFVVRRALLSLGVLMVVTACHGAKDNCLDVTTKVGDLHRALAALDAAAMAPTGDLASPKAAVTAALEALRATTAPEGGSYAVKDAADLRATALKLTPAAISEMERVHAALAKGSKCKPTVEEKTAELRRQGIDLPPEPAAQGGEVVPPLRSLGCLEDVSADATHDFDELERTRALLGVTAQGCQGAK